MTSITDALKAIATEERAQASAWFFKTGKGQYGEGDIFIGISNPDLRTICKKYNSLNFSELQDLLNSPIHEYRFAALIILVEQMKKAKSEDLRSKIYEFYLDNTHRINNWDLVDCSARDIVGLYLFDKDRSILYDMARTNHLWTQRIAIIATFYFINKKQFLDTLKISEILLTHKHDLIHKAVGWALREAWKKGANQQVEVFLEKNIGRIPRTALRYAIEKMTDEQKKYFMTLK
ncbi:DNA alkylation repair enzyme [Emticicia oligotrophica DSM 17448]|uniref:DNA alkylation repair enzyme n=1 Tax=Emticicia oligotrophica (strain DSM 17448 / CIP 109782 / MTCC 6937 / GPTSA100-15) TaxID=929562 RepID=A0ABN4ANJ6_EMTOG|nr:DNA alkylation repair protein [Emticicia oligotrophica]AFK03720.1 DNA alkylation repair enzyme [Emticicia oligotrophica DSM 17448]